MNYIIVKNASGQVVSWGVNDGNFAPTVPVGCTQIVGTKADITSFADPALEANKVKILAGLI